MKSSLQSHLTILDRSAAIYGSAPAFKLPQLLQDGRIANWLPITYSQFRDDVNTFARHWLGVLHSRGVLRGSVVALWLQGMSYTDVLHVFGLSRAGYVPQLLYCSANASVIFDLLRRGNAQALIYGSNYVGHIPALPISAIEVSDPRFQRSSRVSLPDDSRDPGEMAFIFHTAGVSLGIPKLVPCNYAHLDWLLRRSQAFWAPKNPTRQDVYSWKCTISHGAPLMALFGRLVHGSCHMEPTRPDYPSSEVLDMIARGGVNRLHRSISHLASDIREFRKDRNTLSLLSGLDEIMQCGNMLDREDEEWLTGNGLPLSTAYGTAEVPMAMVSEKGAGVQSLLRPVEGVGAAFFPISAALNGSSAYQNVNTRVVELVIPSSSPHCPDVSLRNADGHFHTGDLFLEVAPGAYAFRGRIHDWILNEIGQSFDVKVIEQNVRLTCGEFIAQCVVVGNGRSSPALLVEPTGALDIDWIKKEIIRRTRHFHSKRLPYQRITSQHSILVVAPNSWPRTPLGLIRRRDVEATFKNKLDRLYADMPRN